ncbi:hypothetical protein QYM36_009458 [Artemia franciscana]|uniref:Secreted protein n=1 Tax=Artemia franciscana TaxID=6661 RepID=A0AA88HQY7_ARTSF|nr:hypothetical protein QYM36_009458 [Artemia franciscana]
MFWKSSIVLLFFFFIGHIQGQDSNDPCEPYLADNCFTDVSANLVCQMSKTKDSSCARRNVTDLCVGIEDALRCTSDVIDTDCKFGEGREKFDAWLQGLRAVYYSLCGIDKSILTNLVGNPHCWSIISFLACTQRTVEIDHVNDLLNYSLDLKECNRLLVATATCNVKATSPDIRCAPITEQLSEVLHTFFSATNCGTICPKSSASAVQISAFVLILSILLKMCNTRN